MLNRLALTVIQSGFDGVAVPDWLRRALDQGLGGVVLFARNLPSRELVARVRAENPDAVVAVDEEGGVVTRLEARQGSAFPGNRALGVVDDLALTERVGREIARLLARYDITLNYAPCADVNVNPANPVIGVRSFGPEAEAVALHTAAWIRGHQGAGVAACAKHFPGHGDTETDSHLALPTVRADLDTLLGRELAPFRAAVAAGVRAVMCGHLLVPALDPALPATFSPDVLTGLLRDALGFDGMLVTDAIEMKAVAGGQSAGRLAVRALAAGADAVCVGRLTAAGLRAVQEAVVSAVRAGELTEERLVQAAGRVTALASWQRAARDSSLTDPGGSGGGDTGSGVGAGLEAARRAVEVLGSPHLTAAPHVLEFNPRHNQAVEPGTPTHLTLELVARLPATTHALITAGHPLPRLPAERPLLLLVHDTARHPWVRRAVADVLARRPDAVVVETGVGAAPMGRAYLATHGPSRASAIAAADRLLA